MSQYYTTQPNGKQQAVIEPGRLTRRYKAYKKILLGAVQMLSGFYELATGEAAPKTIDVLRG